MTEVVLFHHVQGLTTGVLGFADSLRQLGHTVHTPVLFERQTFATIDDGMDHAQAVGFDVLVASGVDAASQLPAEVVYAGLSLGVMPAQLLAQTRPGARGALLLHGCLPVSEFGPSWPDGVPVQVHAMDADPFFAEEGGDIDAARELVASTTGAELFLYPGDQHLFTDASLPAYDETAAALLIERVGAFLSKL